MSFKEDFNVFVGGKSGVLKGVKLGKKAHIAKNLQKLASIRENDQISCLKWGDDEENEILVACGLKAERSVKIYDTDNGSFISTLSCNIGQGPINGLFKAENGIVTAFNSGEIVLWKDNNEGEIIIKAGKNLSRMRQSPFHNNIVATGGQENELRLFDLQSQSMIFKEKNVRHDWLELRVPQWISDITFFPGTHKVITAGRYGHVRLYDTNAQRRPVINIQVKDEAFTTLSTTYKENHVVVGCSKGKMNLVDLRQPGKVLNTYKGFVGSVTGISCSNTKPFIVSVGLDRYLRVHDLETKKLLKLTYLTSRLTSLVIRSDFSLKESVKKEDLNTSFSSSYETGREREDSVDSAVQASEREFDELFDGLRVVGERTKQEVPNGDIIEMQNGKRDLETSDEEQDEVTHSKLPRKKRKSRNKKQKLN